jgi:DNA-binding SARP family transcriptional activator/tetratricopeptide (TPR) repeat protein
VALGIVEPAGDVHGNLRELTQPDALTRAHVLEDGPAVLVDLHDECLSGGRHEPSLGDSGYAAATRRQRVARTPPLGTRADPCYVRRETRGLYFRILGPLEVHSDGQPVPLRGPRQRALLAILLLHAGETVSTDRLIDLLWGETAPAGARKALSVRVSELRKQLEPVAHGADTILTRAPGYALELGPDQLDLQRFERLRGAGRAALDAGDPQTASERLGAALGLWRGPPLADFAFEPFAQAEIARLEELRLGALEDRIAADLELGRHAQLVGELEALVSEHPLRERPRGQLMLALHRGGRQVEALEVYREGRRALVDELGLEPSRELRALEQAILAQDPALDAPVRARAAREPAAGPGGAFVGRDAELAELMAALADARAGRGRVVLVSGEPGIGKSRLAEEVAARAEERGARVLSGRCWEAGGAPAFWPWVQALRSYMREREPEALRAELGPGGPDVARVLPELRALLPQLPEPPTLAPDEARFRLFDATATFLRNAARARPLVVVLDDLHAADAPSLLLLEFIADELDGAHVMILGAYRHTEIGSDHALASTLAELARKQAARRIMLAGLTEVAVARYIELSTGVVAPDSLVAALHRGTEGNPLFLGELARLLSEEGLLERGTLERLPIPRGVHEAIGHRLRRLSGGCHRLLVVASGLGREFSVAALERVSAANGAALLEQLDEARAAYVVEDVPGVPERLRFSHALVRDALYEQLGAARRVRLHAQIGEALVGLYERDPEPHLAEMAHHFYQAAPGGDHDRAIDYAWRAGERAGRLLAYEEAVRLYRMALAALEAKQSADEQTQCELLLALGDALARSGEMGPAKETFAQAADVARRIGRAELLARAAIGYGGRFVWVRSGGDTRLVPLVQDALAALPEDDSVLRVKLLARLAGALRDLPSARPVASISREALEMARRLGDPATLAYALDGLYAGIRYPQHAAEWRAMAAELVQVAEAAGDKERAWAGHQHLIGPLMLTGDLDGVDAELQAMERLLEELKQPAQMWAYSLSKTMRVLFGGRFEEAEALLECNRELGRRAQTPDITYTGARVLVLFVLRREQGRLDEVEDPLARYVEDYPELIVFRCALAALRCDLGQYAEAGVLLEELAGDDFADLPSRQEWLFGAGLLAEVCAQLGDRRRAAALYELLLPYADCNLLNWVEVCAGSVSRYLGLLASTTSRWPAAERHFEAAIDMDTRTGGRPWLAHTQADYASMLLARAQPGDPERARELTASARATYHQLAMHAPSAALLERVTGQAPAG